MGGSSGDQTTTQRVELPAYEDTARQELFSAARGMYQDYAPQFYDKRTFAQQSPYSQGAIDELAAFGASPYSQALNESTVGTVGNLDRLQNNNLQAGLGGSITNKVGNFLGGSIDPYGAANRGQEYLKGALGENFSAPGILDVNRIKSDAQGVRNLSGQNVTLSGLNSNMGDSVLDPHSGTLAGASVGAIRNNIGDQNPYIQRVIRDAIGENNRQFNEQVLPGLRLGAIGNNALDGSRAGLAEGLAAARLGESNARLANEISLNEFNNSRNRELQAASLAGNLATTAENQNLNRAVAGQNYGLNSAQLRANVDASNLERGIQARSLASQIEGQGISSGLATSGDQFNRTVAGIGLGREFEDAAVQDANSRIATGLSAGQLNADIIGRGLATSLDASRVNAGFLPTAQQIPLMGTEALLRAGQIDEAYRQQLIDDERARFDYYQQLPETKLANYAALISGNSGVRPYTTSATAPGGGTSTAAGAIGGAATGAGLASSLGLLGAANAWNPAGWAMLLGGAALGAYGASQS